MSAELVGLYHGLCRLKCALSRCSFLVIYPYILSCCRISKDVEVVVEPAGGHASTGAAAALSTEVAAKSSSKQLAASDDEQKKAEQAPVKVRSLVVGGAACFRSCAEWASVAMYAGTHAGMCTRGCMACSWAST
jgi:hypothetical protein